MKIVMNIDWLEVYGIEPKANIILDADYYEQSGYGVRRREYGTKQYKEMFTLRIGNMWAIEVRRNPHKTKQQGGVMETGSVHLRLTNEACYLKNPIKMLLDFMEKHCIQFKGISRLDICGDFCRFRNGIKPKTLIEKYMRKEILRVNKGKYSIHGEESWEGREIQTIEWGRNKSMVTTKLYNKTRELEQMKPKQHIKAQWDEVGLQNEYKNADVWRLEFSIKSSCKKWIGIIDETCREAKQIFFKHDLQNYTSKDALYMFWQSLAQFYFRFKKAKYRQDGSLERKNRCDDWHVLDEDTEVLKPKREVECNQPTRTEKVLINYLTKMEEKMHDFRDMMTVESIRDVKERIIQRKICAEIDFKLEMHRAWFRERESEKYRQLYESVNMRNLWMEQPIYSSSQHTHIKRE